MIIMCVKDPSTETPEFTPICRRIIDNIQPEYDILLDNYSHAPHWVSAMLWLLDTEDQQKSAQYISALNRQQVVVVTTIKNNNKKYLFTDLVDKATTDKTDLCVAFTEQNKKFNFELLDPEGHLWYRGTNIQSLCTKLKKRLNFLCNISKNTDNKYISGTVIGLQYERASCEFYNTVNRTVNAVSGLKNFKSASYRCHATNTIAISQTDLDSPIINEHNFLTIEKIFNKMTLLLQPIKTECSKIKSAIDTPSHIQLYETYYNINYIIRTNYYIENAPFTKIALPYGAPNEIKEIQTNPNIKFYAINLYGQGSLIMAHSLQNLQKINYVPRPIPEIMF